MAYSFDVIVVGAGPAGSACALAMGESGLKVALIEKQTFPRDKICGDALAPYIPDVLETISAGLKEKFLAHVDKSTMRYIRYFSPNQTFSDFAFRKAGYVSKRWNIDHFLFKSASELKNVTAIEGEAVKEIHREDEGFRIKTNSREFTSRMVVGCDGAQGKTRKFLQPIPKDLAHYAAAVRAYYKNIEGVKQDAIELHFLKSINPGYFWIFPLPNGTANVGLGMKSTSVTKHKRNLRKDMMDVIENNPIISERFKNAEMLTKVEGFGLPLGSKKVPISGEGFMFCGDTAYLIEPLTGEGIGQAIISGRYAGWQAIECFEKNDFSAAFMKQYDKRVYDKLWKAHKWKLRARNLYETFPFLLNLFSKWSNKSKWLKTSFEGLMAKM